MPTKQGDLSLLNDPVAQELLHAKIPLRLAYTWPDGTPRVIPINFHWDGTELVMGSPPRAPKIKALRQNPKVAITIDTEGFPAKVLLIRGTANLKTIDGIVPEYAEATKRYMGEEGSHAWLQQLAAMRLKRMTRIAVRPEWVGIIDFQTRFPSEIEKAMEAVRA